MLVEGHISIAYLLIVYGLYVVPIALFRGPHSDNDGASTPWHSSEMTRRRM